MKVSDVMTRRVVSVRPDASIMEAGRLMLQHKISGVPVVDPDGRLVGIVTERDFLRRTEMGAEGERPRWFELLASPEQLAAEYAHCYDRKVEEVMTRDPITVTEDTPVEEVVRLILERDIKRLPVTRGKHLVGIVARADLVRALRQAMRKVSDAASESSAIRKRMVELERQSWVHRTR